MSGVNKLKINLIFLMLAVVCISAFSKEPTMEDFTRELSEAVPELKPNVWEKYFDSGAIDYDKVTKEMVESLPKELIDKMSDNDINKYINRRLPSKFEDLSEAEAWMVEKLILDHPGTGSLGILGQYKDEDYLIRKPDGGFSVDPSEKIDRYPNWRGMNWEQESPKYPIEIQLIRGTLLWSRGNIISFKAVGSMRQVGEIILSS